SSLIFIVFSIFRGKRNSLLLCFLTAQILLLIGYADDLALSIVSDWGNNWLYTVIDYLMNCYIRPVFLLFFLLFIETRMKNKRKWFLWLFLPPTLIYLLLLTDPLHHWFFYTFELSRRVHGPGFWIHSVIATLYQAAISFYMVKFLAQNYSQVNSYQRKQTLIIITSNVISILAVAIQTFLNSQFSWEITSVGIEGSSLLGIWATHYRFFNITPLALRPIAENMKEAIIVVDNHNEINSFNERFRALFLPWSGIRKSDPVEALVRNLETRMVRTAEVGEVLGAIRNRDADSVSGELTMLEPEKRSFMVHIQPIKSNQDLIGRVISFNEISDYKNLLEDYDRKNMELMTLNQELVAMNADIMNATERLQEYAATVEELAIAKERNRLARDVHDTLGHTMTLVLTALEVGQLSCDKDPGTAKKYLAEAIQITRQGITELRTSIRGLSPERVNASNLTDSLQKLISDFQISGMTVELSFNVPDLFLESVYSDMIYRICQESLTNSFRHGKSREVSIILRIDQERIRLYIIDDGCGCKKILPGYGLNGMKQRVEDLRGKIVFGSDGEQGFTIHVEIPLH
ncbi:MAG TPA: histidine kinase N-terminal 7TM domain-containing protein, partial [Bacillota bacterium]|nr:histidine kinase N-terminal 7TM domain-containing protein [Bacillota bacterium]